MEAAKQGCETLGKGDTVPIMKEKYFLVTPIFQNTLKQKNFMKGVSREEGQQSPDSLLPLFLSPPVSPAQLPLCQASSAQY